VELTRNSLALEIQRRLEAERATLARQWQDSVPINYFVIDDLLPHAWTQRIREAFPRDDQMVRKRSLRELKLVAAQMDKYDPLLEESIYAFQAPRIVELVHEITGLRALEPDELLYAGGISSMARGHFLNPHVDNSHDKFRNRYRVLNLLFYVSPDWTHSDGCNLELWPEGPRGEPVTIVSRFNRLVVMVTHEKSWHSVSANRTSRSRCCVSNYYFSKEPVGGHEYFHVTSFRGRPEQPVRDVVLRADIWLRMALRKLFPQGVRANPHFYDRRQSDRAG
jgi:Rps23 Pro-64 3,4-dihydroxylase Tpa1-like proline 4-hydroxylase